ncbi:acyltransferase family protein [Parahaliea aestuarii]|uniref:acyltransferase family protein n=1 Tax=Parahaliea aestuarii TaxID=1852021 RepID=UPI00164F3748|nr:acyltransferase [Parahaliea aestuarii]
MAAVGLAGISNSVDLTAGLRRPSSYRFELECLRGLAILLVFLFHAYGITWGDRATQLTPLNAWVVAGNTGVTLFFVLSGFLLSLPWLQHLLAGSPAPSVRAYYHARCLRILPLYLVWVAAAALLTGHWSSALRAALFQPVGFSMFPYSVVWWTLCTEVQFYLVLPLAFWCVQRGAIARAILATLFITWLIAYFYWAFLWAPEQPSVSWWSSKSLFGRLPAFLVGIALAWWYASHGTRISGTPGRFLATATLFALLATMSYLLWRGASIGDSTAERLWHIRHTLEAICWALLIILFLTARPLGSALLLNRPMAVLGKLSYSIYLNHVPILFFLIYPLKTGGGHTPYPDTFAALYIPGLALLISVFAAWLTYTGIELPFLKWKAGPARAEQPAAAHTR